MLKEDSITFGKYKNFTLSKVLRDRSYCKWLLEQDWFQNNYSWLYNRILEYNPSSYFIKKGITCDDFLESYTYFNLIHPNDLKIDLEQSDKICYKYYFDIIERLRQSIYNRLENEEENPYNIKAPVNWLKTLEKDHGIPRVDFKEFLSAYDLINIPYIIERIKKEGGIDYKGARSFKIAKSRSEKQEKAWEKILKEKYQENISTQFKYENCIFDFLNISTKTIFECKLGLKDFDEIQHNKYKIALKEYRIIYLIGTDCVIDIQAKCIYTIDHTKYSVYTHRIQNMRNPSYLDLIIENFNVIEVKDLLSLFGTSSI